MRGKARLRVAVVGTGISGMAAAWLLHPAHDVTIYESASRPGGHSYTVAVPGDAGQVPVDMGFIVYNPPAYPNLTALFQHLDVPTHASDMSFAVSLRGGGLEYAGTELAGLFGQRRNLVRPRFWAMLRDILRFYREAAADARHLDPDTTLGAYLAARRYGPEFARDHLLPMAAAIWSAPAERIAAYPALAFIRFCQNHGLLLLRDRPQWRSVVGASGEYVRRLTAPYAAAIRLNCPVRAIRRLPDGVALRAADGEETRFDHVVIATHADQALALLADPSAAEVALLGAVGSTRNEAVMHRDPTLMPRRRRVWASWNYIGAAANDALCVTYWMNRLQHIPGAGPVFVTLNPVRPPAPETVLHRAHFDHPLFDAGALRAQRDLWSLQGQRRTWFCGAWLGAGFHEDGVQAGLAVAEALGGVRRPWRVAGESDRLPLPSETQVSAA
ncbi:MAG: FAD-dependent oxidoreductase [Acidibrevibacterium sp.]|jgi:predicted NAD/FAD-binding protein|uniref:NAD(P)/FAD-dependent oxidoreductase n=1 Tax=Acidibrevibacterium fodinaquatile TaxID=1969806 RepID=UPI0023A7C669|nr:FAD-dependent oxidoreductase [Acidibrevibacterium fodinaquatile]MCA7119049.1 FAD-dependent oxidoreductase [Acidibrevibacterium fodinaquatile]